MLIGRLFGIMYPFFMKGEVKMSSMDGLLLGSRFRIFVIRLLAASEMGKWSGKV